MKSPTDIWNEILAELYEENSHLKQPQIEIFSLILPEAIHRLYAIAYDKGKSEGQNKDE